MLKQLNKYSATLAKVNVMRRNLLDDQDYNELLAKNSVNEVATYLKNSTNYKKVLSIITESTIHRGQIEKLLMRSFEQEFIRIISFLRSDEKKFMHIYIIANEIELLKQMMRMLETEELSNFKPEINPYFLKYYNIDPQKLIESTSRQQFIDNLKGSDYFLILSQFLTSTEHFDIFKLEMALDVYYYKKAWELSKELLDGSDNDLVSQTLGMEIDMLNIMWILRSKKYFKTENEIIYSFILPIHYRLKKSQLVEMVESPSAEAAMKVLSTTKYADVFKETDLYIELYYFNQVLKTMVEKRFYNPFSIMSILSYLHLKSIEINNIVKIVEGIRYDVDKNEISRYLVNFGGVNIGS